MNKTTLHIMCVIKNNLDREFHKSICEKYFCHRVQFVVDALEALVLFRENILNKDPWDLVFIEYMLHEMDGITLAKKFKQQAPNTALMLLPTPHLFDEEVRAAYDCFGGFLREPTTTSAGYKDIFAMVLKNKCLSSGR